MRPSEDTPSRKQARQREGTTPTVTTTGTATTATALTTATEATAQVAGLSLRYLQDGSGPPVLVLHRSTGPLGWLPFHDALAQRFTAIAPDLPGYGASQRPAWAREPRDLAILINRFLDRLELTDLTLVGLGFGGFIAAEMATLNQSRLKALVLVGAAGIQPREGEILDQILVDYDEYVRAGFRDDSAFRDIFGDEISPQLKELWNFSREMTARLTWRPYMFNHRLPHLLPEVETPALLVWGEHDRVVPPNCGELYAAALPNARLEIVAAAGHLLELEEPLALAEMIAAHAAGG